MENLAFEMAASVLELSYASVTLTRVTLVRRVNEDPRKCVFGCEAKFSPGWEKVWVCSLHLVRRRASTTPALQGDRS